MILGIRKRMLAAILCVTMLLSTEATSFAMDTEKSAGNSLSSEEADNSVPGTEADSDAGQTPAAFSEEVVIETGLNAYGFAGVTYDLMYGVSVSPSQDSQGNIIQVEIKSVTSTDPEYTWDGGTSLTPANENEVYTITYSAYVEPDGGTKIEVASSEVVFTVRGDTDIGEILDGDYAYISDAYLLDDSTTESGKAVRTGSAPWDEDNKAGNDTDELNSRVRTFDIISYTAAFQSKVRENSPYSAYRTGTLHFEFVLPGTEDEIQFETSSMGWLSAKKDVEYEITQETYNGNPCQVLRGSYLWEPSEDNPAAIGESYQELTLVVRALALKNGDIIKPEFTFWLEHNKVPETGLVTGSGFTCPDHGEAEYRTISGPEVTVTAAPRYNIQVKSADNTFSYVDNFDFSTGNDLAQNKDAGLQYGRAQGYGVTIQIKGKSPQHGLKGCEIPDGSDITFDLTLSSSYRGTDGDIRDVTQSYTPLLWSMEGNRNAAAQADGRDISGIYKYVGFYAAPGNSGTGISTCKNGGTWLGSQEGNVVHITVSGYEVDLTHLPQIDLGSSSSTTTYFDPSTVKNYWEIQNACFSGGEFWIVQPYYKAPGMDTEDYVVTEFGSGNFTNTVEDSNLQMTSISGEKLPQVSDNSNQMEQSDDVIRQETDLENPGSIIPYLFYAKYDTARVNDPLTDGCLEDGKDWTVSGGKIAIEEALAHSTAEGMNTGVAYDDLVKFDDAFFQLEDVEWVIETGIVENMEYRFLYGAKPDKTGWDHRGLMPGDEGYDAEMLMATADDLIFFPSLQELEGAGYTCVGVMAEVRGIASSQRAVMRFRLLGNVKADPSLSGNVYMVTHSCKAWNKKDVQEFAAEYTGKDANTLTNDDYKAYAQSSAFPNRTDGAGNYGEYPDSFWTYDYDTRDSIRTYQKASYDENGYVGSSSGRHSADSCLVVAYATEITKKPAQCISGQTVPKTAYDMDVNQRIADYVLQPSVRRTAGEFGTEGAEIQTTIYIEDTLPKGLTYIPNSSYWGGAYTQTGEGKQGIVEGGRSVTPDITVNEDGTTTLLWTLQNVTVAGEGTTYLDPVYYSCDIGTPGNQETDVKNNDSLLNQAIAWGLDEQKRDFTVNNGNLAQQSILVSKNNAVSLSKTADEIVVNVGEEMPFTMNVGNNAQNPLQVIAMDSLPYTGDAGGSKFSGSCQVTEFSITNLAQEFKDNFKLYYTTEESERGKGSEDYQTDDFSDSAVWKELSVDPASGAVALPEGSFTPVAIAAVGRLPAGETLRMHVTTFLPQGEPGDYVANRLTRGNLESYARSYLVSRTLEGLVWMDQNQNGRKASDEETISGVSVTLMKLKEGGDPSEPADYEVYNNAVVETGKQFDLSTGTVTDYEQGEYKFTNLPEGTFGILFSSGRFQFQDYVASEPNQGEDDTIDSDGLPEYDGGGEFIQAFIPDIAMPQKEQITTMVYASRHHDLGIYPVTHSLTVSKTVTGQGGEKDRDFTFLIELRDREGNPLTGIYNYTGSAVTGVVPPANGTVAPDGEGKCTLTLRHGQSVTITGLPRHSQYTVSEAEANQEGYTTTEEGTVSCEDLIRDMTVGYINDKPFAPVNFSFTKIAAEETAQGLTGAEFSLYQLTCTDAGHSEKDHEGLILPDDPDTCWTWKGTAVSQPEVSFTGLLPGEYRLVEVKAPEGRVLPKGQWRIIVSMDGEITAIPMGWEKPPSFITENEGEWFLPNKKLSGLPDTGGWGLWIFTIGGSLMAFLGAGFLFASRKRRKRRPCPDHHRCT